MLFCITSPSDDDNWFSRLTSFVDDDGKTPLVFSHQFKAVCQNCVREYEPAKWHLCTHVKGAEPTFKDRAAKAKWTKIYEREG